ncbi:MAG: Permease of the drug/metabolite transporter (DMT) superfamily, partial [uncultured Solirubrobacteraceae bacterium]
ESDDPAPGREPRRPRGDLGLLVPLHPHRGRRARPRGADRGPRAAGRPAGRCLRPGAGRAAHARRAPARLPGARDLRRSASLRPDRGGRARAARLAGLDPQRDAADLVGGHRGAALRGALHPAPGRRAGARAGWRRARGRPRARRRRPAVRPGGARHARLGRPVRRDGTVLRAPDEGGGAPDARGRPARGGRPGAGAGRGPRTRPRGAGRGGVGRGARTRADLHGAGLRPLLPADRRGRRHPDAHRHLPRPGLRCALGRGLPRGGAPARSRPRGARAAGGRVARRAPL